MSATDATAPRAATTRRAPDADGAAATPSVVTRTRISLPDSFDFDWMRRFLLLRRVPSLETWTDDTYVRSLWIDGVPARLTIVHRRATAASRASLDVTCAPALPGKTVRALVTRMFDLDADLDAFAARVRRDRVMGPLVRRRPYVRLPRVLDPFEGLVRAMLGQQVTVRAAGTMTDRLVRRFGSPIPVSTTRASGAPHPPQTAPAATADVLFSFPRPDVIVQTGDEVLRSIGLTRAKAAAIVRMAEAIVSGRLDCARLATLASDEAQEALVALPGIGPWTASYVRMRVLGDRDAFPAADLGVIKALDALGVPRAEQVRVAERWRPWRGYATLHLWESLGAE